MCTYNIKAQFNFIAFHVYQFNEFMYQCEEQEKKIDNDKDEDVINHCKITTRPDETILYDKSIIIKFDDHRWLL